MNQVSVVTASHSVNKEINELTSNEVWTIGCELFKEVLGSVEEMIISDLIEGMRSETNFR